jgi:hypothetical protein
MTKILHERRLGREAEQIICLDDFGELWISISLNGIPSGGFHCSSRDCGPLVEACERAASEPPRVGPVGSIPDGRDVFHLEVVRAFSLGKWRGAVSIAQHQGNGVERTPRIHDGEALDALRLGLQLMLEAGR